jgi:hypothetical protein
MLYPGLVVKCAQCGAAFTWRVDNRGKVAAISDEKVLGGNVEILGDFEYRTGVAHPAVEAARYHAAVCTDAF